MEPQTPSPHKSSVGIIASIVVLLGVIVAIFFSGSKKAAEVSLTDQQTPEPTTTPTVPATTPETPATDPKKSASVYKDGTYTATGIYMSPGGEDKIDVTLTIKNDIIIDASAVEKAGDPTSKRFEDMFIAGFKQYVVGKNIATLSLTKVSGSSLTPKGFNDALAKIKAQAKA